jgi:hypothetical protein
VHQAQVVAHHHCLVLENQHQHLVALVAVVVALQVQVLHMAEQVALGVQVEQVVEEIQAEQMDGGMYRLVELEVLVVLLELLLIMHQVVLDQEMEIQEMVVHVVTLENHQLDMLRLHRHRRKNDTL